MAEERPARVSFDRTSYGQARHASSVEHIILSALETISEQLDYIIRTDRITRSK